MKRLMLFLLICCLIDLTWADLAITNGEFAGGVGGTTDVPDWYDLDTNPEGDSAWWNTASNCDGPNPFPDNSAMLGDGWPPSGVANRWIYQAIGTKKENTAYQISIDYAQPTDGNTNRSVGIQIDIFQGIFPGASQDVDIAGQELNLISSITSDLISDMDIHKFTSVLDLSSANTTDPLWIRIANVPGDGSDVGSWVVIDNVELTSETLLFFYESPANESIRVPVERNAVENDLIWTIVDPNIVAVDLYFATENDPNLSLYSEYKVIDGMEVTPGQYTFDLEDLSADLNFLTDYYWKLIGYEPNELDLVDGLSPIPGPVWTFRTINDMPEVSPVDPVFQAVPDGQNTVLTVTGQNVVTYKWYKVGDPAPLTDDDVNYSISTITEDDEYRSELTILAVHSEDPDNDEGYYYCVGENSAGSDSSINEETGEGAGHVMVQRLTSYWPIDTDYSTVVDGNDVQLDIIGGYNMVLVSAQSPLDNGLDYPALDPNVVSSVVGNESLWFNNSNQADPNNAWGQFALIKPNVAEFDDITISSWVYWGGGGAWQRIYDFGDGIDGYMFLTPNAGGGNLRFVVGGQNNEQNVQTEVIPVGEWTSVTITLNGDTARIYVNGELVNTNENFTFNPYSINMAVNYIADSQYDTDPYFNGLIDDLKIYNYALTTEQIAQDYLDVQGEYICNNEVEPLVYDFNDDCQTTLADFAMFATEWLGSNRIYPD